MHSCRRIGVFAMAAMSAPAPGTGIPYAVTGVVAPPSTATHTYDAAFSFQFENSDSAATQNPTLSVTGGMTPPLIARMASSTARILTTGIPLANTLAGTVNADGTVAVTQFGDPDKMLGATLQFLHNNWPNCDFTRAQAMPFSGTVVDGDLSAIGGLKVPCSYSVNQQQITLPTTMIEAVAAGKVPGRSDRARPWTTTRDAGETY